MIPLHGARLVLAATVLVSRQLLIAATEQRGVIEGRLALGLSSTEAFQPHLRQALRTALVRSRTVLVPMLAAARMRAYPDEVIGGPAIAMLPEARWSCRP